MKVSVIIAVARDNPFLRENVLALKVFMDRGAEVLVLPDEMISVSDPRVRVIPTGRVGPSVKRDRGASEAQGEILAILDDDAYPDPSWLDPVEEIFRDPSVAGLGGPAVTPPGDGFWAQVSGAIYSSPFGGGPYVFRYRPRAARDVDDYPTCNLLVRASDFKASGGFDTAFWPGEDTKLCLELVHRLKKRIVYHPQVLVYHHRRALVPGHFRQVTRYALHRGYFVKRFPETSLRPSYFLPSAYALGMLGLPILAAMGFPLAPQAAAMAWGLSFMASWAGALTVTGNPLLVLVSGPAAIASHIAYGLYFLAGLLAPRLGEEKA